MNQSDTRRDWSPRALNITQVLTYRDFRTCCETNHRRIVVKHCGCKKPSLGVDGCKSVFLHGKDEEVYLQLLKGLQVCDKENLVCKLHKSLYVLTQAPQNGTKSSTTSCFENDFARFSADQCCCINATSIDYRYHYPLCQRCDVYQTQCKSNQGFEEEAYNDFQDKRSRSWARQMCVVAMLGLYS